MSVKNLERNVNGIDYKVAGELLPSGAALFTFTPKLTGRAPVISVDEDVVVDVVRCMALDVGYDHEAEEMVLTLEFVDEVRETPNAPNYLTCFQGVPAEAILETLLDYMVDPCENCGEFHFGEDVGGEVKPKKTYLN